MAKSEKKTGNVSGIAKNLKPSSKEIKPATLNQSIEDLKAYDPREEWDGEMVENAPPLELSEEDIVNLNKKEAENDLKRQEVKDATEKWENGVNVWRLISKVGNPLLGWTNVVTAMNVSAYGMGCIVCTKEDNMQKLSLTSVYLPDKKVLLRDKHYIISDQKN